MSRASSAAFAAPFGPGVTRSKKRNERAFATGAAIHLRSRTRTSRADASRMRAVSRGSSSTCCRSAGNGSVMHRVIACSTRHTRRSGSCSRSASSLSTWPSSAN